MIISSKDTYIASIGPSHGTLQDSNEAPMWPFVLPWDQSDIILNSQRTRRCAALCSILYVPCVWAPRSVLHAPLPVLRATRPILRAPRSVLRYPLSVFRDPRSVLRDPPPVIRATKMFKIIFGNWFSDLLWETEKICSKFHGLTQILNNNFKTVEDNSTNSNYGNSFSTFPENFILNGSWRDMTWHDVTWRDMTWHGVTWRGMTWQGVTWRGMTWHNVAWRDMTWHDMTMGQMDLSCPRTVHHNNVTLPSEDVCPPQEHKV